MKLGKLTVIGIKNLGYNPNLDFSHSVIAINGKNGQGKTSLLDAVRFGLTGLNPYGKSIIKADPSVLHATTHVEIAGYGTLERTIHKTNPSVVRRNGKKTTDKAVKEEMEAVLHTTYAIIDSALSQSFINLKAKERSDFFFKEGIINTSFDTKKLLSYVDPSVMSPELENEILALFPDTPGKLYDFNDIKSAYDQFVDARKAAGARKKELAALVNQDVSLENNTGRNLLDLRSERDLLNKELGQLEAKRSTILNNNNLRKQVEQALKDIGTIEEFPPGVTTTSINKEIERLRKDVQLAGEQRDRLTRNIESATRMKEMLEKTLAELGKAECPLVAGLKCTTDMSKSKKTIQEQLDIYMNEIKSGEAGKAMVEKAITDKEAQIAELQDKKTRLERSLIQAKNKATLETQLRTLPPEQSTDDIRKDIVAVSTKISKLDELIEKQSAYDRAVEERKNNESRLAAIERRHELLQTLVEEFAPNGIKSRMLAKVIGTLQDECNDTLAKLSPGYSLRFDVADSGLEIYVTTAQGYEVPMENLSTSEIVRLGMVIQYLIARMQGVDIIVVDNLDSCVDETLDALLDAVVDIESLGGCQVIMVKAGDFDEVLKKPFKDLQRFYVEGGIVKTL